MLVLADFLLVLVSSAFALPCLARALPCTCLARLSRFLPSNGVVRREEYSFPSGGKGMVPILHGPGIRTQATVSMLSLPLP